MIVTILKINTAYNGFVFDWIVEGKTPASVTHRTHIPISDETEAIRELNMVAEQMYLETV